MYPYYAGDSERKRLPSTVHWTLYLDFINIFMNASAGTTTRQDLTGWGPRLFAP